MHRIFSKTIKEKLDNWNISYVWENYSEKNYTVSSMFSAIDNGFYYYSGNKNFNSEVKGSLIIMSSVGSSNKNDQTNQFINLLDGDPQQVYYLLLNSLFGRRSNGVIAKTAVISKTAILGKNVQIDDFCVIEDDVEIENDVVIGSHTKIHSGTLIKASTVVESGCIIGTQGVAWVWDNNQENKIVQPQLGGVLIKENCFLGAGTIIVRGSLNENSKIGKSTLMAPGGRIGHGSQIGDFVHFANNVVTGGNTKIGDYSFVGSAAVFRPKISIHPKTIVGAGSVVVKNTTKEGKTLIGVPAKEIETTANPSGMPKPKL